MRLVHALAFASISLCTTLLACGDKDGDDTGGTGDGGAADGGTGDGGTGDGGTGDGGSTFDCATETWAAQTAETRPTYMNNCVVPVMKPLFQGHDAERFADFGCATCHGPDYGGGTYQMPSVFALDWANSDEWTPGYSEFMTDDVMPTMAGLLGYEPYDYKTNPDGWGCAGCHQ